MTGRGRRRAAAVSVVVAVAAGAGAGASAFWPTGGADTQSTTPAVAVLSPRRAPEVLRRLVADTRLASRVDAFARTLSSTSCIAINVDGAPAYAHNVDAPLIPASS